MRLLAATWLIAPTVLSTNAVFAVDNQTTGIKQSQQVHLLPAQLLGETTDSSAEGTTGTTDSSTESRPNQLDPASIHQKNEKKPAETIYPYDCPSLIGKIQTNWVRSEDTS